MDIKDLFYRPDIEPTRNYRSDSVILHEEPNNTVTSTEKQQLSDIEKAYVRNVETIERLLRIRQITPLLPEKIVETINSIFDTVITGAWLDNEGPIRIIIEKDGGTIKIPEPDKETPEEPEAEQKPESDAYEIPTSGEPDEDGDYEWPEMTSSGFDLEVEESKNIWELSEEQYLIDQSLIREAFSKEYNNIMEPYIYQLLTAMDEAGLSDPKALNYEYEGETVSGISEDCQHLNDIIVRNQLALTEMTDLFLKSHDLNETSATLSSFDVIAQERTRYLKEKYNEAAAQNYIEMYDKNLLAATRREYAGKYIIARANTYKFLHSAVVLSEDMLSLALSSNLAKCSLVKKGIDIFVKKEYQNEDFEDSTETKNENGSVKTVTEDGKTKKQVDVAAKDKGQEGEQKEP